MSDGHALRGGLDYPQSRVEFDRRFGTEAACLAYLVALRWPTGFVCPNPVCAGRRAWLTRRRRYQCTACGRQVSPTAGTIFEGTRKPLRTWLEVAWQLTSQEAGISARSIEAALGLGSYQTAWAWLHKLRRAMAEPEGEPLSGLVEAGTVALWGVELAGQARATVAIAVEVRGGTLGRVRVACSPDLRPGALRRFVASAVEPGATLRLGGQLRFGPYEAAGYRRESAHVRAAFERARLGLPNVEAVARRLEEWATLTHGGAIRQRQLDAYFAEFTFRFNARGNPPGLAFYRLLERAVKTDPTPFAALVGGRRSPARFEGR